MADNIEFTKNYADQCTPEGFQFEFYCDRCGSGFRTPFKPSASARVAGVMDAASSLLGGVFGRAADLSRRAHDATWEQAHDKAFREAMTELKPQFSQCPHCSSWVCRKSCWSEDRGLCKNCAPDMGVEMSAAQAAKSREEVWAHAKMSEEDKKLSESNWRQTIVAQCPKCEAKLDGNLKFCPECGEKLHGDQHCTECGATLKAGAKFCGECGAKVE
jgi:hypothetical protein